MASSKNSVTLLKELHDRRAKSEKSLPEPTYTEFVRNAAGSFKSECVYCHFTAEGSGKTKKEAKIEAARQMLTKLGVSHCGSSSDSSISNVKQIFSKTAVLQSSGKTVVPSIVPAPKYNSCPETEARASAFMAKNSDRESALFSRYPPKPKDLEVCFNDIDFGLKSSDAPKSSILLERRDREMHPIDCFEKVMDEFGLRFWAQKMDTSPEAGEVYVVLIKIDFHFMVVGGKGASLGEAVEKACRNGIDTFRLYMR